MATSLQSPSKSSSRRALLAGALGGIGALAAGAIGRPKVAQANDPNDVLLGGGNVATTTTSINNTSTSSTVLQLANTGGGNALYASSTTSTGIAGVSGSSTGVYASSDSEHGVHAESGSGIGALGYSLSGTGVHGECDASGQPAIRGQNTNNSTGILGYSGGGTPPSAKSKTGVYGRANQDSNAKGIYGDSPQGYAGYFNGRVYTTKFYEMTEISNPPAPTTNRARLFVRDDGSGKTQLCVRFEFGAIRVLATQA